MENRKVRLGMIGLGPRGETLTATLLLMQDQAEVYAICDRDPERLAKMKAIYAKNNIHPKCFTDADELLAQPEIEGVLIPTSWNAHLQMAIKAAKAGKYVGMEVGGSTGIEELWELVRSAEATNANAMMLENCCYARNELMALNMKRLGLFGELVHCECGYCHDIFWEQVNDKEFLSERGIHNYKRNGDLYPTHGIGPIAKILDINRGNRFLTLSSISSKSCGFELQSKGKFRANCGDVTVTTITCANGETVTLFHNIANPRPYSRRAMVQGTNGLWSEDANSIFIKGISTSEWPLDAAGNPYLEHKWDPVEKFYEKYDHPIWKEYNGNEFGSHGGVDALMLRAFCRSIATKEPLPIDIYDTATWMCITALSEQSVAMGGMPVPFPDFTCGRWINREPQPIGFWTL